MFRARQLVNPITRQELDAVAQTWVDTALRLQDRDLKMMGWLVRAQMRRMESGDVEDIAAEAEAGFMGTRVSAPRAAAVAMAV